MVSLDTLFFSFLPPFFIREKAHWPVMDWDRIWEGWRTATLRGQCRGAPGIPAVEARMVTTEMGTLLCSLCVEPPDVFLNGARDFSSIEEQVCSLLQYILS